MSIPVKTVALLLALSAAPAFAQPLLTTHRIPASLAAEAAIAGERACAARGYDVSVTVVTRAGGVQAVVAGDRSNPLKTEASRRKAYTAALLEQSSAQATAGMPDAPAVLGPLDANLLFAGGGLPILVGGELVGAVGTAGAPGGDKDELCSRAAIDRILSPRP